MMTTDNRLQEWIDQSAIRHAGEVKWHLAIRIQFVYFRDDVAQSRQDVVECMGRYLFMTHSYMRFWAIHGQHMKAYEPQTPHTLKETYETLDHDIAMQCYIHSGPTKNEAGAFLFQALDRPKWKIKMGKDRGTSNVEFLFPLGFFAATGHSLPDFVNFCADRLKPYWGYAGIGLAKSADLMDRLTSEPLEYMLAWSLPELEVQNIALGVYAHEGLRPPSWMTILGDQEVQQLGGRDALKAALPAEEGFILTPFEWGGVSIQAGAEPLSRARLLGTWEEFLQNDPLDSLALPTDPEKMAEFAKGEGMADNYANILKLLNGEFLPIPKAPSSDFPLLYKLAKVLKPLRAEVPRQLHDGHYGVPYFDQGRTLEYYARFDEEEEDD